jgi:hypothetical protein
LKDAASFITAAWTYETKKSGTTHNSGAAAMRIVEAKLSALEEENATLRRELAGRTVSAHECPRCSGSGSESGRPLRKGKSDGGRIDALERKFEELGLWIIRAIDERYEGQRQRFPQPQHRADHPATPQVTQISALPREQEGDELKVVESKKRSLKKKKGKTVAVVEEVKKVATAAPSARSSGAPKTSVVATITKKGPTQTLKTAMLPRAPRTSAVTLTLSEEANMSYADVLVAARKKIPLKEIGVDSVDMKKAMTGAIIIRVPGDKDRGKASLLAACLDEVLNPTTVRVAAPTRTAELRVVGIDISVDKEVLRQALPSAAGCGSAEVQVGQIGASRGGLGSAGPRRGLLPSQRGRSSATNAWNWDTYGQLACPPWIKGICVTGATDTDILPGDVPPPYLNALCASRLGRPLTTEWAEHHAPLRRSTRIEGDPSANQRRNRGNLVAPLKQQ